MKFARNLVSMLVVLVFATFAFGQVGDHPLVIPGTELGWESARLELVLRVSEKTPVILKVFSPGFDPGDYRSPNELGDERYDGGKGELKTLIRIFDSEGKLRLRKSYGNEPHRWYTLINGDLAAGDYLIDMQFFGNGKNALAFKLLAKPSKAVLQVAPGSMQTYNVHGPKWQYPFRVNKRVWEAPFTVGIYDGDGPKEIRVRAEHPGGVQELPAPGNGAWVKYDVERPGAYRFGFRQPKGARQYTNTVGFEIFLGPVRVEVVDERGNPVEGASYATKGYYDRTVALTEVPDGWTHVATEARYGKKLSAERVLFGPGGGSVRYVLRPKSGTVAVSARAVCGVEAWAVPVPLRVGDRELKLSPEGKGTLALPAGRYPVAVQVPGARVRAPAEVQVEEGREVGLELDVEPQLRLSLDLDASELATGGSTNLRAVLATDFPYAVPASLRLTLPEGLKFEGDLTVQGTVQRGVPLELSGTLRGTRPGSYTLTVSGTPCAVSARAALQVRTPAALVLTKKALTPDVTAGEEARFLLEVENRGQQVGRAVLEDALPDGLEGENLHAPLELGPGETKTLELRARVATDAPPTLTNTALLMDDAGRELGRASASVRVLRPQVLLTRSLDKHVVVPGETVQVCLQVRNPGKSELRYDLEDRAPDWLKLESAPSYTGALAPGEATQHCYPAGVRSGPPTEGVFHAQLRSNAGPLVAEDAIRRVNVDLSKKVNPARVLEGEQAEFVVEVHNPTDHRLTLNYRDLPEAGLGLGLDEQRLTLDPDERTELRYRVVPQSAGRFANEAQVFVGEVPAAEPARAVLEVLEPISPRRESTVRLPFAVEGSGDALLIAHRVPEGAAYRAGSSRLGGRPLEDPRVTEDGRLVWRVPFAHEGTLSYELAHEQPLPPLEEPELTLLAGDRAVPLVGRLSPDDYKAARPLVSAAVLGGLEPGSVVGREAVEATAPAGSRVRVNGRELEPLERGAESARYRIPLEPGANRIEVQGADGKESFVVYRSGAPVRLSAELVEPVADGRTPLHLRVSVLDAAGLPTGTGTVTLQSLPEPLTPDADPLLSGYQARIENGVAEVELEPMTSPGEVVVRMALNDLEDVARFYVPGPDRLLWLAQGSITARYHTAFEVGGLGRAYAETPLQGGTLQAALDAQANLTGAGVRYHPGLLDEEDPTTRFPLTGSGTEARQPLTSDDGVALRYDRDDLTIGYHRTGLSLPGIGGLPRATALYAKTRGDLQAGAFLALLPSATRSETIVPDGTRTYALVYPAHPGSEQVFLVTGAKRTKLEPLRDYVLDYPSGLITLARPLWPTDLNLAPVRLEVSYAPAAAVRDQLAFGAGGRYSTGPFTFGVAAATLNQGSVWKFGAEAAYRTSTLSMRLSYGLDAGQSSVAFSASGREGPVEAEADLRYDGSLQGRLRVASRFSEEDTLALEHRGSSLHNRTAVLYERRFGRFFGGLGLGYEWNQGSLEGVGRAGYQDERTRVQLTHQQSFSVAPSLTVLGARHAFDANLTGTGELAYTWGEGLAGTLGLEQRLGPANLSLSYVLPGASGRGNRARFGIEAPLPLNDRYTLDLSAGYEKSLNTPDYQVAAGAGVRYRHDGLSAGAGVEAATGSHGGKVTLRAGASGQLDERQVVAFDANFVTGSLRRGRFTLAYALRGEEFQVLTYHRLETGAQTVFEGELAPTWHPTLEFQLRPSAAYRVVLADPGASLYQLGLGANYYFTRYLGLGGGAYYLWQPGAGADHTAFNVEGSLRVLDPLWLNLGYTFGGFQGITPEARPGVYLRLDFFTGSGFGSGEGQPADRQP